MGKNQTTDLMRAAPATWNNFVYNTSNPPPSGRTQSVGLLTSINLAGVSWGNNLLLAPIAVHHNTVTYHDSYGWSMFNNMAGFALMGYAQGNVIWYNNGSSPDLYGPAYAFLRYSDVEDPVLSGNGNISLNPQLVSYQTGDLHLKAISPCIDVCPNYLPNYPYTLTIDIDKGVRPVIKLPPGNGYDIDMGADEVM